MDIKERILAQASELFMRYGIRSVSMDEIAKALGISKKTIYQYFHNKAAIVYEVTLAHFEAEEQMQLELSKQAENALEELTLLIPYLIRSFKEIPTQLIFELQKYYPKAWQLFERHKQAFILVKVRENLERGIREGLYRANIPVELMARIRLAHIDAGLSQELFPPQEFDHGEVQLQMFELYMYGIVSDKGRALLNTYMNKVPQQIGKKE
ncbi:MAG: TetR/AcrR family transcriptional regulator [Bacteroidetes bacterium]|nr:MAG: TetR/AcrR family transcriptional regulator [Bacteroidota bacterium]